MERKDAIDEFGKLYYWGFVWAKDTKWMGIPVQKYPSDLWVYQEILCELRPDLIVETGTAYGGSALFLAQICEHLGNGNVITIDPVEYSPSAKHERILYFQGSSISPDVFNAVAGMAKNARSVMVVLDSDHKKAHVAEEMRLYAPLVTPGSYLVVEDTNIDGRPIRHDCGPGPGLAVDEFLASNKDFEVDRSREKFLMTANPGGYLKRIRAQS